jgi:lipopolysaccharide transport system ATP-binding protein
VTSGESVLVLEGVWKRFKRRDESPRTIKQAVVHPRLPSRRERFWALQDINLRLSVGDTVGLIGANGSGKSTLLRLAGGLGRPTRGRIFRGRKVGAMMTLGESFDQRLTGRENALTAGIVAGYTRRQALAKLDEIVAFSELEESFDLPIRTYSDGMRMRLAFSVAISAQPEILLIDEVLSVGDIRFRVKCFDRLAELQERGTTILLASHEENQIESLCSRAIWLVQGRMQAYGPPDEVFQAYSEAMRVETERRSATEPAAGGSAPNALRMKENRFGTLEVEIVAVRVLPDEVEPPLPQGQGPVRIEIDLEPKKPIEEPIVGVSLHRIADAVMVLNVSTAADGVRLGRIERPTTVSLMLDRLDARPGSYRFDVGVYEKDWSYVYDYHWQAYPLEIRGRSAGGFGPPRRWQPGR